MRHRRRDLYSFDYNNWFGELLRGRQLLLQIWCWWVVSGGKDEEVEEFRELISIWLYDDDDNNDFDEMDG